MPASDSTQRHPLMQSTPSVELARKYLQNMPTGGKTPLPHGLMKGYEVIQSELRRDPDAYPFFILISDGRANVCLHGESALEETIEITSHIKAEGIHSTVIDTEVGDIRFGFAHQISDALGARHIKLEDLRSDSIVNAVKSSIAMQMGESMIFKREAVRVTGIPTQSFIVLINKNDPYNVGVGGELLSMRMAKKQ